MNEFDLIRRYFKPPTARAILGVGDDCALLAAKPGYETAISTDMLIEGRHFFADVDPESLGHKALAVNLSDLAAMGAHPVAFTLALSLPSIEQQWLELFSRGLLSLTQEFDCELVGGDTTRGPLAICITVIGEVPIGQALRRDAAKPGDEIWVSGTLGDAALALEALRDKTLLDEASFMPLFRRLERPAPRVTLGQALLGSAHAAIDLSDGLAGDLRHILDASGVGAAVELKRVPLSAALRLQAPERRWRCALAGGDDYELCFTAPASANAAITQLGQVFDVPLTRIGVITAAPGLEWIGRDGQLAETDWAGFDHFRSAS